MASTTTIMEPISADKQEDLISRRQEAIKNIWIWGALFFFMLLLLFGGICLMAKYLKPLFSVECVTPLLTVILFFRMAYLSGRAYSSYIEKNRFYKKDLNKNEVNITTGQLKRGYSNLKHIVLDFEDKMIKVNMSAGVSGFHVHYFAIMEQQKITIRYLPSSGLIYSITFHDISGSKILSAGSASPRHKKISGIVTMIAVYRKSFQARFLQARSYYETRLQLGNTLLYWHKDDLPEIGSSMEILING